MNSFVQCLRRHLHLFALGGNGPEGSRARARKREDCSGAPSPSSLSCPVSPAPVDSVRPAEACKTLRFKDWAPSLSGPLLNNCC